jgi:predicted GIY-YIG superfamily endonuclease
MYSLYLLYAESGTVAQWKIGVTTNLQRRFNEIKLANPNAHSFMATYSIDDRQVAYGVEAMIKKQLKSQTISGEWVYHEALSKDKFIEMCRQNERSYRVHLEIQKNINTRYDY